MQIRHGCTNYLQYKVCNKERGSYLCPCFHYTAYYKHTCKLFFPNRIYNFNNYLDFSKKKFTSARQNESLSQ
jgi:hypothetical protein